jgi:hypothetical protein
MGAWRSEWFEQVLFAQQLRKWLDPATSFATAIDSIARLPMAGFVRRKRGVRAGCPDNWIVHRGELGVKLVCIEMKSPVGRCSRVQREARAALVRVGAEWWECRSAAAAMVALAESGVPFREFECEDGRVQRWGPPRLEDWEVPRRDPAEKRPMHPEVAGASGSVRGVGESISGCWRLRRRR